MKLSVVGLSVTLGLTPSALAAPSISRPTMAPKASSSKLKMKKIINEIIIIITISYLRPEFVVRDVGLDVHDRARCEARVADGVERNQLLMPHWPLLLNGESLIGEGLLGLLLVLVLDCSMFLGGIGIFRYSRFLGFA